MISYREKQLLMVQKMLQDDTEEMAVQMSQILEYIKEKKEITSNINIFNENIENYDELVNLALCSDYDSYIRVDDILSKEELLEIDKRKAEIDKEFSKKTGIVNKKDLSFLVIATVMQCIRQYYLTSFNERPDDKEAAKQAKGESHEEHSDRKHRYYNPSLTQVMNNPVPFDAIEGSKKYGALKGGGKLGHRAMTLGHDPILGLFFGTMNIATSTLTTSTFQSYHIETGVNSKRDAFKNQASMGKILYYSKEKLFNQGATGKAIIGVSLLKEIEHLKSDVNSKNSLGIPIINTISPQFASELANYGIDTGNVISVGKQATYALMIDTFISMLYNFFNALTIENYNSLVELDKKMLDIRRRKILLVSNLIASSSNIIYSVVTNDYKKLDIGGILVTISHLFLDVRFMTKVKKEFVENIINEDFERRLNEIKYDF